MNTKILYVLVSSEEDYYFEQVQISATSLKYHNPNAYVVLLVDEKTNSRLNNLYSDRLSLFDEIKAVAIDERMSNMERSRVLKTSARKYVDGDFLFVDTDTVILGDISDIDRIEYDMAAVLDAHAPLNENPYKELIIGHAKKICNKAIYDRKEYYNSGVIYVKDNERTREFYEMWNENWRNGCAKGVYMDQPSFAKAQNALPIVKEIDGTWNCQLRHGLLLFNSCRILHYLCTNKSGNSFLYHFQNTNIYIDVRRNGLSTIEKKYFDDVWFGLTHTATDIITGEEQTFLHDSFSLFLKKQYLSNGLIYRAIRCLYRCTIRIIK